MKFSDKQLKYSIRKFSIGVASVAIGAVYLSMGAHVAHAGEITPSSELQTGANGTGKPDSDSSETKTKTVTRTIKYVDASDESKEVSTIVTQTVTLERKQGTNEWTTGKWEVQPSPTVEGYNAPDKSIVEEKDVTASTENEKVLVYYSSSSATTTSTRGRRTRRALEDGTSSETTGKNADSTTPNADLGRKGNIALPDQPGVIVPEKDQEGGNDPNANLEFDKIKDDATTEELWNIINKMPDDFQNNERSYLRNMNTLGDDLRFKEGKVSTDGTGDKLQDGEIRELDSFGGWTAIAGKDGTPGKFVIGKKNADGYFTGWYVNEKGERVQGGMLGADALDNIYVHEQALDRRFKYMLMLVKGRTRANRNETVSDKTEYDPRSQNERAGKNSTDFKNLPFLVKDEYNKYSPGVVGYNGIEKTFKAFSSQFGSRVRVEFVTGYISDINGSKGSYRIVVNAKKKDGTITKVYDQTINRVAEIVQNEELYKKGLNVELAHERVLSLFKDEFHKRVNSFLNPKIQNSPLKKINKSKYDSEQKKLYDQFEAEATEEAKKQGDIVLNVDPELMSASKTNSEWKKTFTAWTIPKLSNELNNLLKFADKDTPNTPTWLKSGDDLAKADDRAYRLLTTLIPGAKKITYHVNEDQLEVETEHYTYIAARNGSKEAGIQGSEVAATLSAKTYGADESTFDNVNTNTKANERNNGWARSGSEEFKNFSHFVGVDKGIVRDKVITDEELTKKIKEKIGEGDSNLGKGGYFSTGDILLEKDVVSYTVQVFSADNNRVGVNPQSHRVQYNLPILADFSVIQNTVKPAIEVAKKIVPKLNIPEEDKKKITEEIEKKKKTSEIAELISGSVKVRYVDENGKSLSLKNDAGIGEKESDGTYITNKRQLIGTAYDVRNKKLNSLTTTDGTYYTFKEAATDSADLTGDIVRKGRTVTLVYRESEAPAAKGDVTVKYENENGDSLQADNELKKQAATGDSYDTKTVKPEKITKDGKIYKYKSLKEGSGAEVGTVGETAVVVTYVYELVKGDVTVKYENENGDSLQADNELKKQAATGDSYDTKTVKPEKITKDGKIYKYKSLKEGSGAEVGTVGETAVVVTYVYELVKGDVTVKYENENGDSLQADNELKKQAATGDSYDTKTVKPEKITKDGKIYKYKSLKEGSGAEVGTVGETAVVVTYVYELVKGDVTVKYENENGDSLQADNELKKQAATGDSYDTKTVKPEKITKDGKIYKYKSLKEGSGAEVGTVGETAVVVTYVYELVKGDVTVKYENENGDSLQADNELKKQAATGDSYDTKTVKPEKITKDGKIYKYKSLKEGSGAEVGTVGETAVVVTYVYELVKGDVTVKYENEDGVAIDTPTELKKAVDSGTDYDATPATVKKAKITTADGKVYKLKGKKADSAEETGKVSDSEIVITYVYELVKTPDNPTSESPDKPNPDNPIPESPDKPNQGNPDNPTPESPDTPEPDKPDNLIPETPDSNRPEEPNNPEPDTSTSVSTTKVELPNTGTVTNGFFTAEVAAILAGLGILIPGIKKKETEE